MKRGLFVVIEGVNGSGKTTLINAFKESLDSETKDDYVFLKEPSNLPTGQEIKQLLKNINDLSYLSPLFTKDRNIKPSLFIKDREENIKHNIKPSLSAGKVVIQDRYYYSTMVYQGLDDSEIKTKVLIEPDLLFYLDADFIRIRQVHEDRGGDDKSPLAYYTMEYESIMDNNDSIWLNAEYPLEYNCSIIKEHIDKKRSER